MTNVGLELQVERRDFREETQVVVLQSIRDPSDRELRPSDPAPVNHPRRQPRIVTTLK